MDRPPQPRAAMCRYLLTWPLFACLLLPVARARASTPQEDEALLKEAKVPTDADTLVEFFRKRILPDNDAGKVKGLITRLGDDRFRIREKASADLIAMGPGILKALRENVQNSDYEIAYRVKEALDVVERTSTVSLLSAAARLLGHKKHPDAAKVLLDFAPVAESDEVIDAIRTALADVAVKNDKPEPALVAALSDKQALRRSLAADALIRTKGLDNAAARKLMKDTDPLVRLRAALALIDGNDKEAVPALIDLLPTIKLQQAWVAEDILCRLAGEKTPADISMTEDEASRKTARTAWEKWWKDNEGTVDLKKLKELPPYLGFTVIAYQDNFGQGRIQEQDKAGKMTWEFQGLTFPVTDVQILGNDRVLISELNAGRVSIRNKKGEITWQKQVQQPVACQRLVNGNTVVSTRNTLVEYNAEGKEVFTYNRPRWDIMSARKHRNGEYLLMTQTGLIRVNAQGKEVGSIPVARNFSYGTFDILPNGNVLLPLTRQNKVVEYKLDGTEVWSVTSNYPTSVQRLPNGNTLVTSMNYRTITEFDKAGKQVGQTTVQGNPWVAVRR
jgi:hypothetical protein